MTTDVRMPHPSWRTRQQTFHISHVCEQMQTQPDTQTADADGQTVMRPSKVAFSLQP